MGLPENNKKPVWTTYFFPAVSRLAAFFYFTFSVQPIAALNASSAFGAISSRTFRAIHFPGCGFTIHPGEPSIIILNVIYAEDFCLPLLVSNRTMPAA